MTGEPMTTRAVVVAGSGSATGGATGASSTGGGFGGRAPHLQPPHANHPLQALRTDDIEVQVIEQGGIELCASSERKLSVTVKLDPLDVLNGAYRRSASRITVAIASTSTVISVFRIVH
uniref:Uncharacterized protein n=1 Tax=Anopheles albimanus TaxID=7167 RepID=A0A182FR36_ANOAL